MKLAIIGYGAVAAVHARQLQKESQVMLVSVFGPDGEKAARFAAEHGVSYSTDCLQDALTRAEAVLICSPSPCHFEQAKECLEAGKHTLVELPPCENVRQVQELGRRSQERHLVLRCAHTSRYLIPYKSIRGWIQEDQLGPIRQVIYIRHLVARTRSWVDDALLHHAAHPLDLLIDWFGQVLPLSCTVIPQVHLAQNVLLSGQLPEGTPVAISISYTSRLPQALMLIIGDQHTIQTDGFSYLRSDSKEFTLEAEEVQVYGQAIHEQDLEFLQACRGEGPAGIAWQETVGLLRLIDRFSNLSGESR